MGFHRRNLFIPVLFIILLIGTSAILLIGTSAISQVAASDDQGSRVFEEWMVKYKRVYESKEEKEKRFAIFKTAFKDLKKQKYDWRAYESYIAHLHMFSDRTFAEIPMGCHNPEDLRPPVHDLRRNPHGLP